MDARRKFWFREKHGERLGKRHARIRHADDDFTLRTKNLLPAMMAVAALFSAAAKNSLGLGKREVARLGGVGGGEAGERGVRVTEDFAGEQFCDFSSGQCHFIRPL